MCPRPESLSISASQLQVLRPLLSVSAVLPAVLITPPCFSRSLRQVSLTVNDEQTEVTDISVEVRQARMDAFSTGRLEHHDSE